ncbi:hypothetical protein scyTo_0014182 [Scyliorhinus torazame]|uniref:Myosin motor domain-containing protein n=1 Tax=Scyliorhinus torazame TaxID=75743 RepID=A0A401NHZ5_SCYTO|nr:hypothetical protein [Scyliorhinus torazame]
MKGTQVSLSKRLHDSTFLTGSESNACHPVITAKIQIWRGTIARLRYKRVRAVHIIINHYRRYKVKSYIREVRRRFQNVGSMKDYGKHVKWPTPPKVLRKLEDTLQSVFQRWRAYQLIKSIPPADLPQIKAKVAAVENLKGQRVDLGLQRTWEGNYLATKRDNPLMTPAFSARASELKRKDKYMNTLFSSHVRKVST